MKTGFRLVNLQEEGLLGRTVFTPQLLVPRELFFKSRSDIVIFLKKISQRFCRGIFFISKLLHSCSEIFLSRKISLSYDFSYGRNCKVLTFYKPIKIGCCITKAFYACIQIPFSFHIFPRSCTYNVYQFYVNFIS